jgi:hypothetical protein
MTADSKSSTVRPLDRLNPRLPGETFDAIDAARQARPCHVSRNTRITEAVEEKLARERGQGVPERAVGRHA